MKRNLILTIVITLSVSLSAAAARGSKGGAHHDAGAIFDAIDTDDSGGITAKELGESRRFKDAGKKEVGEAFKSRDLDGDGLISEHEFRKTFGSERGDSGKGAKGGKGGKGGGN